MVIFGWDVLSLEFWSLLLTIVFIDLLLAGDNAIVIGLAARSLPKDKQKLAVVWGMLGAVLIRIAATLLVVSLLKIPYLLAAGGALLLWIAYKLLVQEDSHQEVKAGTTLWAAVRTIVIADAAMGLDNVIAVAGAAHGDFLLVVLGLLISIPIVVWGSTLFIKLIDKFPWIIYLGSGVLAYTASKMIAHETRFAVFFERNPVIYWAFVSVLIALVLCAGWWTNSVKARRNERRDDKRKPVFVAKKSRESH
ncbi:TerC family protein [Cohnella sp. LGH]|uniref:YjbE family integral membrane protein n=1 Tax=Cohnella phaseoli TaxID=456490 RepID=A0A3D9IR07_9BACL|nr:MULTISPECIES: TerC family protein [Cohnella]QTH46123.1 TerC family protein [Cohnella sp. LGH]RED64224.1 YjbE family integral membrane protein [Cohnella phaseoli]